MCFDVILVTDTANFPHWSRGYGAHRLASHLRIHNFSVLVIDFSSALTFDTWKTICEFSIGSKTRMVGFSTTWWPYREPFKKNQSFKISNIDYFTDSGKSPDIGKNTLTYSAIMGEMNDWVSVVKKINSKCKIVIGGPKIDFYRDFPADYFISGLGENQIIDILTDNRRIWPTLVEHDINSNNRDWGWQTSSTVYTDNDFLNSNEILNLEIARGCKFKCNFCSFPLIGQKDVARYLKTEDTIYNELMSNYNKFGVTKYFIADDTFNDSIEKLEMMARIKNKLPFDLKTKAYIRADIIATQLQQIPLLYEGGLASCYIGIESFHPVAGKFAGKGMNPTRRKQALYEMNRQWKDGVSINGGYIVGLPGEDEKFVREQAEWFSQPDCPVNYGASFLGLIIHPYKEGSTIHPSEIDKNPESFGYHIPDKNKPTHWIKNDGTDILSYDRAHELATELSIKVWSSKKDKVDNVDYKTGAVKDPLTEYFLPLIDKLKERYIIKS